jgi:hypothetical protein
LIKYIQIFILLLTALFSSDTIKHSVSIQYSINEKFQLLNLKDIISIEINDKKIEVKSKGFGKSLLEEDLEYKNQNLSDDSLFHTILVNKIVPLTEDEWIDRFLLDNLSVQTRFLFSEVIDGKRVYRLDIKQLNKDEKDNLINTVILNSDIIKIWADSEKNIMKISFTYNNISYVIKVKDEK